MARNFEVFTRTFAPLSKAPAVTVQQRGQLSLNKSAFVALGSPEGVELMYDRDDRVIGIRPADPAAPHAYKPYATKGSEESGPYLVAGKAFLAYFKIDVKQTRRYPAKMEDGALIVDMKQAGTNISSSRNGHVKKD